MVDLWFTENQSKTGGKLTWSGSNLDNWRFVGEPNSYPELYNYGSFTSRWLGELTNMTPGVEYVMTMDFRSSTGESVVKTISYTIQPSPVVVPTPTPTPIPLVAPTPSPTPIVEIPEPNCDSVITNLQYIPGPAGATTGQLTWQTSGTGKVQYFGDIFLYPAIFNYGMFTTEWTGSLLNLMPGIRYIVSVNFFADCQRLSGVSTSALNPKLVVATPIPTVTITEIAVATATPTSSPSRTVTTSPPQVLVTESAPTRSPIATFFKSFAFQPNSRNPITGQDSIHIVLHNLIPGQQITITLRSEKE